MNISTIGGALIAALILFFTGLLALLQQEGVSSISDINQVAWIVLGVGALISFLKDFQALSTRKVIGKLTGTNVNSPFLVGIMAMFLSMSMLAGCAGTRSAYQAADGLEETAFVMNQHYLALVSEANGLAAAGTLSGSALVNTQGIVRKSYPLLRTLSDSARAYESVRNAETEQELTRAIAAAAVELSNLLNAIRRVSGSTSLMDDIEADSAPLLAAA